MRITRHTAMMQTAEVWSRRSTCFRRGVGAVISCMGRIVSIGYNGPPSGDPHCTGNDCVPPGKAGCIRSIHAEHNAIRFIPSSVINLPKILYTTESPCPDCAELIAEGNNIVEVYYLNEYRDFTGILSLLNAKIPVFRMTPSGYIINRATGELVG